MAMLCKTSFLNIESLPVFLVEEFCSC